MKVKLGQNFLIDKNVAKREIEYAGVKDTDIILEIGPGKGILTKLILEKAKKVIAIEYDKKLYHNLNKEKSEKLELILADAIKVDLSNYKFNKIIANLPFQISSPITFKLLGQDFESAVMIYQLDFAKRMVAMPGSKDYSNLTVIMYYKTFCEIIEKISKNCFNPKPKVDAAIVRIFPLRKPPFKVKNEKFFFTITRLLFNHRRKMINTIISNNFKNINFKNIPFSTMRVGELTPENIGYLSDYIFEII